MADEKTQDDDARPSGPLAGTRLRRTREEKNLKLEDLARDLHVDEATLSAIEENRFADLGAPVFAKGHLRKYAEALGVATDDILAEYYQLQQSTELPPVVPERRGARRSFYAPPWMYALAVTFFALALLVWWFVAGDSRITDTEGVSALPAAGSESAALPAAEPPPRDTEAQLAEPLPVESPAPATDAGPADAAASRKTEQRASREPPVAAGQVRVVLLFSGECWAEIRDAANRRIYSGVGNAGDRRVIQGAAPLYVVLGNARAVELIVNGSDYAIPASSRRGRTARFQIPVQ